MRHTSSPLLTSNYYTPPLPYLTTPSLQERLLLRSPNSSPSSFSPSGAWSARPASSTSSSPPMHPTTPPTPSRRAPRAPKNPRRRVRSESDRKKHAGWRHCPRCSRSVSTNGRNFYHHMHKCDRVYFADLIAKVDSAVAPVSTPLPPPVPRVQSSPITPTHTPNRTPVKMTEMQRVIFLQQLCFLRVYDRTVDAVLKQIEQTDASIFSPAAFEAVRRAKGIEPPQPAFSNPKPFSPPYSPLGPPVHPPHPSPTVHDVFTSTPIARKPPLVTSQPIASAAAVNGANMRTAQLREPGSNVPNGAHGANTPYSSNGSLSVSTSLPGNGTHVVNPRGAAPHINVPVSGSGSACVIPQGHGSMHRHSIAGLPSSEGHMSRGLPIPGSSALSGTAAISERPVIPGTVAGNLTASQANSIHSRTIPVPDGRAVSEPMGYSRHIGDAMSGIEMPGRIGTSNEIPVSGSVAFSSGSLVHGNNVPGSEAMLDNTSLPQNQQAFPLAGNIGNRHSGAQPNLGMGSSLNPTMGSNGSWRRDAQRFSAPAGSTPYSSAPYGNSALSARPLPTGVPNMSASAAAVANTPVSRVASAMSISSVINT